MLIIHHIGKGETTKYRGSSDILAGVDTAYALQQVDGGLMHLHRFKSRFAAETTFTLRADLATGSFDRTESQEATQRIDDVESFKAFIAKNPGATQHTICEAVKPDGIFRTKALELLRRESGHLWRVERGKRRSIQYFPMTEHRTVPTVRPLRGADGVNTTGPSVPEHTRNSRTH